MSTFDCGEEKKGGVKRTREEGEEGGREGGREGERERESERGRNENSNRKGNERMGWSERSECKIHYATGKRKRDRGRMRTDGKRGG
jgi:hypothetical protein